MGAGLRCSCRLHFVEWGGTDQAPGGVVGGTLAKRNCKVGILAGMFSIEPNVRTYLGTYGIGT